MAIAPFTDDQVASMNAFQDLRLSLLCDNDKSHEPLVATSGGWQCVDCDYTSNYAAERVTDWSWTR
jgi:hypothetical protein